MNEETNEIPQECAEAAEETVNTPEELPESDENSIDSTPESAEVTAPEETEASASEESEAALREEIAQLRRELELRDRISLRAERESAEFRELYPEIPTDSLPDSVWEDVRAGLPLAAAYALCERRRFLCEKQAAESNQSNRSRAAGRADGCTVEDYSPAEVRAMTPAEVRANYTGILRSMKNWR